MKCRYWFSAVAVSTLLPAIAGASPTLGQIDTFQNGTTDNWQTGRSGSPTVVSTGGPAGAGDEFLQMFSTGIGGPGSKAIIFNHAQWAGNYTAAGVSEIDMDLKNLGTTPVHMRLAFNQFGGGPGYETINPVDLPAGGGWQHAVFRIGSADLTPLESPPSLGTVLSNVAEVRILSAASPSLDGDTVATTIGIDNIKAVPEPMSGCLLVTGAALLLRRGRVR